MGATACIASRPTINAFGQQLATTLPPPLGVLWDANHGRKLVERIAALAARLWREAALEDAALRCALLGLGTPLPKGSLGSLAPLASLAAARRASSDQSGGGDLRAAIGGDGALALVSLSEPSASGGHGGHGVMLALTIPRGTQRIGAHALRFACTEKEGERQGEREREGREAGLELRAATPLAGHFSLAGVRLSPHTGLDYAPNDAQAKPGTLAKPVSKGRKRRSDGSVLGSGGVDGEGTGTLEVALRGGAEAARAAV